MGGDVRAVIASDCPLVRSRVRHLLEQGGVQVVGEASNEAELLILLNNGDVAPNVTVFIPGDRSRDQGGNHNGRGKQEHLNFLSARETEILRLAATGKTTRQIADALGLSPRTIDTYTRRIYDKLDVNSRIAAVARAYEMGLM